MATKTAEQIAQELKELTASKKELESKISSLNHELFKISSAEKRDRLNFVNRWSEDTDQLAYIDDKINEVRQYFEAINLTIFSIVRRDRKICLFDTTRYIDIDSIMYNRENLDEVLDWLEYHKTYAAFYRDVTLGYLTFDKPNRITRLGRQMLFEVRAKDESLGDRMIIVSLETLEDGNVSIVMQLGLVHYGCYYELKLDDTFSYSVESDDKISLSLTSNEVICKINEVEERIFKLKEAMIELYKNRKDMISY